MNLILPNCIKGVDNYSFFSFLKYFFVVITNSRLKAIRPQSLSGAVLQTGLETPGLVCHKITKNIL